MGIAQQIIINKKRVSHCLTRFKERHGLYLSQHEYFDLIEQIINNESIFLMRVSNRITIHKIKYQNEHIPVIYSNKQKIILTVYQNNWFKKTKIGWTIRKKKPKEKKVKSIKTPWRLRKRFNKPN